MKIVIDTNLLYEATFVATLAWFGTLFLYHLIAAYVLPGCSSLVIGLCHAFNILVEVPIYFSVRLLIKVLEFVFCNHRSLRHQRRHASSYEEWLALSKKLDELTGRSKWAYDLTDETAKHYSWTYLEELMEDLRAAREEEDVTIAVALLQLCLRKNVGGIFSSELYSHLHTGEPKQIIKDFVAEVVQTLEWVTEEVKNGGDKEEQRQVKELLERSVSTYGRRALCLSGGAMIGNYHLGAVQAYKKTGILPKIMSGSSMGSIIAAFTCTRTEEEFERDSQPGVLQPRLYGCGTPWSDRIDKLIKTGAMWDKDEWLEGAKWFTCGELTFLEAYRKTGRTLNISLSTTSAASPPVLLNHITAPDVYIYSAIVCSASAPSFLPPGYLIMKKPDGTKEVLKEEYFDGSMEQDIPKEAMQEQLNCQFFTVIQANPQLLPFQFYHHGSPGEPTLWNDAPKGGSFLSGLELYVKMDMKNRLRFLRDFGVHRGGMANAFTQDLQGDIDICVPFEFQDFLKVVDQPSEADLVRYHQGGNYMAYGSVAMIQLHSKISDVIDECRKSLKILGGQGEENEVERLVRPTMFGGSMDRKTIMARRTTTRKSVAAFLQKKRSVEFKIEEEDEDVDDMWYNDIRDSDVSEINRIRMSTYNAGMMSISEE